MVRGDRPGAQTGTTNSQMLMRLRQANATATRTSVSSSRLALAVSGLFISQALGADRTPPLPVPRPRFDNSAPVLTAPGTTGSTSPAPAARTEEFPQGHDPFVRLSEFPRDEQREILRRCASEWDHRKKEGKVTGLIWRDYLEACIPNR